MPRVRKPKVVQTDASKAMVEFTSTRKAKTKALRGTGLASQLREVHEMMAENEWGGARASHLVALYVVLHEMVYGVEPELRGDELAKAKLAAGSFLKSKCDGEFARAVDYMRWVWARERGKEEWRKANHIDGKYLGWHLLFRYPGVFTEYKVAMERRKHG